VKELGEAWTQRWRRSGWRRSVVLMVVLGRGGEGRADGVVPGCGGEGRADGAVPRRFNMEEERGAVLEEHVEDAEDGAQWRQTWRGGGGRGVAEK
jgi:hypothetical protein